MSKEHRIETPEGRLINHSLWEKEQYEDPKGRKADPSYKIEMAFDEADIGPVEEVVIAAAVSAWGDEAEKLYLDGAYNDPILSGDELADKREAKGKQGDAYRGKMVIRAKTIFNKDGDDAPGGVYVADENAEPLDFANRSKVYRGCYGVAVVNANTYEINGERGISFYLDGFQFTRDGDRLGGGNAAAGLFKPQAAPAGEAKGRRGRGK